MKKRMMTHETIRSFKTYLLENERADTTIEKYMRDIRCFAEYVVGCTLDKALILNYKAMLEQTYAIRSANSMLAALNAFLRFAGWHDLCVKQFRVQKEAYCSEEKELTKAEYTALVRASRRFAAKGISAQLKAFVCESLLQHRKGYCKTGGYSRPFQR